MDTAWHKRHVGTKGIKPSGRVETKVAAVFAKNLAPAASLVHSISGWPTRSTPNVATVMVKYECCSLFIQVGLV